MRQFTRTRGNWLPRSFGGTTSTGNELDKTEFLSEEISRESRFCHLVSIDNYKEVLE
jgi:hypothetical protein